ncbi:hypothetical protein A5893_16560 [Pedobacter psychrophilus]|uniref:Outer membrane protein beta-barrel domain-containing protein n=1 Tax=Pedobacter psychrophilus TaxID=1826909 RepID=A0A179DBS8_9SPHI|nr:hypothetical protein [Pedobacter psychrophilus]OAQ37979.1 hypothetical protein A5893_16560 [Pedobacter psychrophilus]
MKKVLLTIAMAVVAFTITQAQIQKGNVLMGANISNINFGLDKPNVFSFNLNPKVAWFVADGVALGTDLNFGLQTAKNAGTDINYGIGALGRYYSGETSGEVVKNSMLFGEATVGISGVNPSIGGSTNGLGFSFGPGFTYFITNSIGLEALLKYNGVVGFGSSAYAHSLSLGFGFQVYLPGQATARKVKNDMN